MRAVIPVVGQCPFPFATTGANRAIDRSVAAELAALGRILSSYAGPATYGLHEVKVFIHGCRSH